MKNKFKKLISLLLVFSMIMQNVTVFADIIKENINEITSNLKNYNEEDLYEEQIENSEQLEQEDEMEDIWAKFNETEHTKSNSITDFFRSEKQISIKTVDDLININNDLSGSYILENDIDLDNELWEPIGNKNTPFIGMFDGNGHEISNLKIDSRQRGIGFFGVTDNAVIKNIILSNIEIEAFNFSIGTIVGYSKETELIDVGIAGNININNSTYHGRVGGFIGESYQSNITDCYVSGVGNLYTYRSAGAGFIGMDTGSIINRCFAEGISIKIGYYHIGGFIASANGSKIYNSYSTCNTTPASDGSGFIFNLGGNTIIENCYYAADVKYPLYGRRSGTVQVNNSYFDATRAGIITQPEHGRTTDEMMQQKTYEEWDFENIWESYEGEEYPTLQNVGNKGDGTKENPYIIRTVKDLEDINKKLNGNYKLMNDINLEGINWEPIGTETEPFKGVFDGNNHTIKNLEIKNKDREGLGLFGYIDESIIKNVHLENANIDASTAKVGALVGQGVNLSLIENCSVVGGEIKSTSIYVGGIAGLLKGYHPLGYTVLSKSYASNFVITEKGTRVSAGLVGGLYYARIQNCYSTSFVQGGAGLGVVSSNNGYIENSYFAGSLADTDNAMGTTFINSYFDKDISNITKPIEAGKSTKEMMSEGTYEDWNFETIWGINEGKSYPYLKNNKKNEFAKGSVNNPVEIYNVEDFKNVQGNLEYSYKLMNDINLEGINWEPIGTETEPFKGIFDGNNHTIKNLEIKNKDREGLGLFGYIDESIIKNVHLENANIDASTAKVGALVGQGVNLSLIENCSVVGGEIKSTSIYVGGIAGLLKGYHPRGYTVLSKSYASNFVITEKGTRVSAGLVGGLYYARIKNCYSTSFVQGGAGLGVVSSNNGYIENSYFAGSLADTDNALGTSFTNSYFDKEISNGKLPVEASRTTSEMMMESTYEDWDFETVWNIDEGNGYPYLRTFNDDNPIASEASIKKVITPKNSAIKDNKINILVSKNTSKTKLELEVTKGATWSLYKDEETTEEIDSKDILLASNTNTFYIKLKDQDDKNKIYELVIEKTDEIPSLITGFSGVPKDGKVYLSWDVGYEANVSSYTIYKSDSFDGDYKELETINDRFTTTYTDTDIILDKTYYYKIVSKNEAGNTSDYSEIVIVSMGLDEVLPVILSFSPQNNSSISNVTNLEIKAEDNILLSKIILEYLKDGKWVETQSKTINNKQGTANFNISSIEDLVDGEEIKLRALAVDSYGNISEPGIERAFKVKTSEPNKVLNVTSEPFQTRILLKWSAHLMMILITSLLSKKIL